MQAFTPPGCKLRAARVAGPPTWVADRHGAAEVEPKVLDASTVRFQEMRIRECRLSHRESSDCS
jgi:hypothetical protein